MNAVETGNIQSGAVDTDQLALSAVTADILDDDAAVVGLRANTDDFLVNQVTLEAGTDIELNQVDQTITISSTASGNGESAGVESLNSLEGALSLTSDNNSVTIDPDGLAIDLAIGSNAISATELADDAVETVNIVNQAITTEKIAADAIDTDQLASNAVTADILADDAAVTTLQAQGQEELVGGIVLIGGDDIVLDQVGQEITINSTASGNGGTAGVESLNLLDGALSLSGDGIIEITPNDPDIGLSIADGSITKEKLESDAAVLSLSADGGTSLTDAVNLIGGSNIDLTQSGQDITIDGPGSGVQSLNSLVMRHA